MKTILSLALSFGLLGVASSGVSSVYNEVHQNSIKKAQDFPSLYGADYADKATTRIKEYFDTTMYLTVFLISGCIFVIIVSIVLDGICKFIIYLLY